jgi:hypothetical protein
VASERVRDNQLKGLPALLGPCGPSNLSSVLAHGCSGKAHRMTAPLPVREPSRRASLGPDWWVYVVGADSSLRARRLGPRGRWGWGKLAKSAHSRNPRSQRMMDDWISASEPAPHEAGSRTRDATKRVDRSEAAGPQILSHVYSIESSPTTSSTPSGIESAQQPPQESKTAPPTRAHHPFKDTRTCNKLPDVYM